MYIIKVKEKDIYINIIKLSVDKSKEYCSSSLFNGLVVGRIETDLNKVRTYKTKSSASNSLNYVLKPYFSRHVFIKPLIDYSLDELEIVEVELKIK